MLHPVEMYGTTVGNASEEAVSLPSQHCRTSKKEFREGSRALRSASRLLKSIQDRIDDGPCRSRNFAVLLIDVDSFRRVGDGLGMAASNEVLAAVGKRLHQTVRHVEGSAIARWNGDRFVILVDDIESEEDALTYAGFLSYLIKRPMGYEGHAVSLTACVGVSFGKGGTYDRATQAVEDAGVALNRAKAKGKGEWAIYTESMRREATTRFHLESALRLALERSEFQLHYQPKVSLENAGVSGFEALLRWNHPDLGMVSPGEFIPLAEELGLIADIGRWTVSEATRQLGIWRSAGIVAHDVTIAINVSTQQLKSKDLLDTLRAEINLNALAPTSVALEITESALLEQRADIIALLREVRDMGIGLDLDDFGTGYSSLSYLHRFPFRSIKIDQSFVRRMGKDAQSARLVAAIVGLAQSLDLTVIAEGVETVQQARMLRAMGCPVAQGYLFCRPLSAAEIGQVLTASVGMGGSKWRYSEHGAGSRA